MSNVTFVGQTDDSVDDVQSRKLGHTDSKQEWRKFYLDYKLKVYRIVTSYVKEHHAAEDLTQEVFITAFRKFEEGEYQEMGKIDAWLYKIAKNTAQNHLRKKQDIPIEGHDLTALVETQGQIPMNNVVLQERNGRLREAIQSLGPPYTPVFQLLLQGFQINEIAERLSRPAGTVRKQQERGLKRLKEILSSDPYFNDDVEQKERYPDKDDRNTMYLSAGLRLEAQTSPHEETIAELVEDYKLRRLAGETPDIEAHTADYPEGAKEIREDIEAWEFIETQKGTWDFLDSVAPRPPSEEEFAHILQRMEAVDREVERKKETEVISIQPYLLLDLSRELLVAEGATEQKVLDPDQLRLHFNEKPIQITTATRAHVTIRTDNEHIVLHFRGEFDFNDVEVKIESTGEEKSIIRRIQGSHITFALDELDLKIQEIDQIEFELEIDGKKVRKRLL